GVHSRPPRRRELCGSRRTDPIVMTKDRRHEHQGFPTSARRAADRVERRIKGSGFLPDSVGISIRRLWDGELPRVKDRAESKTAQHAIVFLAVPTKVVR